MEDSVPGLDPSDGSQDVAEKADADSRSDRTRRRERAAVGVVGFALGITVGVFFGASAVASRVAQPPVDAELRATIEELAEKVATLPEDLTEGTPQVVKLSSGQDATSTSEGSAADAAPSSGPAGSPTSGSQPSTAKKSSSIGKSPSTAGIQENWKHLIQGSGKQEWASEKIQLTGKKVRIFYSFVGSNPSGAVHIVKSGEQPSSANKVLDEKGTGFLTLPAPPSGPGEYRVVVRPAEQFAISVDQLQ